MTELHFSEDVPFYFIDESQTASGAYTYDDTAEHSNLAAVTKNTTFISGQLHITENIHLAENVYINGAI